MDKRNYTALRETIHHCVLPNGLNIYVDARPEYGKQFAFFATRYGGMDLRFRGEDGGWVDTPQGVAHFLEHKLFDTEDGSALQRMAAQGVDPNAYTTPSMTGYYFEGVQGFEDNLRTLLSFVSKPWFTPESVAKEQGIIGQEIRMCEDDPSHEVYYQLMEAMYASHPVRVRVAGTVESIAEITADTLYQCHRVFYRPGNMVLCAAGNVDPGRVAELAQEVLEPERSSSAGADYGGPEPPETVKRYVRRAMAVSIPLFELGFKGDPAPKGEGLRQRLLAGLVCDALFSASAPLYSRLYGQGLINGSFDSSYEALPGCVCLIAGGESREPERVLNEVLEETARLAREGIDPVLWERLKKAAYGAMVRQLNSLEDTCFELAQAHFDGEDYFSFPQCFQSIERADAEALLRTWCVEERAALSVITPLEGWADD
ncbi:MAG: insulinase family protein [Oscillospiraceae bacterium]|nr:insulinase family protein [Oscillospiraceae bacterium]